MAQALHQAADPQAQQQYHQGQRMQQQYHMITAALLLSPQQDTLLGLHLLLYLTRLQTLRAHQLSIMRRLIH